MVSQDVATIPHYILTTLADKLGERLTPKSYGFVVLGSLLGSEKDHFVT